MKSVFLLTGPPGCGKTSFIKQAVARLEIRAGGFYTEEIKSRGVRQGFRLVTLDGETAVLSHIDIKSPQRVSKYGVDIESLDRVGVAASERAFKEGELVVIDEIGKMELLSARFREAVLKILNSGKRLLATIMLNPNPCADAIKSLPQVKLVNLTRTNHPQVMAKLQAWL
ncbi:MAG: nucleoside-triphosphatase [Dehalococcoidia bacterium]